MSRGYADTQFTHCADVPVRVLRRNVFSIGDDRCRVTLSDDEPEGIADLIARMFTTLASAPDLTDDERRAVRERMLQAVADVSPNPFPADESIPYLPADQDGETYWQGVGAGAESIARGVGA